MRMQTNYNDLSYCELTFEEEVRVVLEGVV